MLATDTFDWVLTHTGSQAVTQTTLLQHLWGGYGELRRLHLQGGPMPSAILKRMVPRPDAGNTVSDRRKHRSYAVERAWYQNGAQLCDDNCRVARCYAVETRGDSSLLLLEDLATAGFHPGRPQPQQVRAGLRWLAHFHSRFLQKWPLEGGRKGVAQGLWEQGSYWHLETRQEEWRRMPPGALKDVAQPLDQLLRKATFQTLLHGDAKPANFCWSDNGQAAAVDFQYVGPGCGIRDVAYFLDCCLDEAGCESQAKGWLDYYFEVLSHAMRRDGHILDPHEVETEWRQLFPVAWSDFCRFWQGWGQPSPLGPFSRLQVELARRVIDQVFR